MESGKNVHAASGNTMTTYANEHRGKASQRCSLFSCCFSRRRKVAKTATDQQTTQTIMLSSTCQDGSPPSIKTPHSQDPLQKAVPTSNIENQRCSRSPGPVFERSVTLLDTSNVDYESNISFFSYSADMQTNKDTLQKLKSGALRRPHTEPRELCDRTSRALKDKTSIKLVDVIPNSLPANREYESVPSKPLDTADTDF